MRLLCSTTSVRRISKKSLPKSEKRKRSRLGWMLFSAARVLRSFSPFSSSITRSDLNFALKFLLCLDMIMNPFSHTGLSISDSLKSVRKSVLIYETIIVLTGNDPFVDFASQFFNSWVTVCLSSLTCFAVLRFSGNDTLGTNCKNRKQVNKCNPNSSLGIVKS